MKKIILFLVVLIPVLTSAQNVAISNDGSQPDSTAMLDIKSTGKGLLIPRMNSLQRNAIVTPAIGLTVFDTNTLSYWMYRGDLMGGWAELQHTYQAYWTGAGANVYNTNSGNIGIGTNSPTEKLMINGIDPAIGFMNAASAKGFLQANGNNLRMGTYNSNLTGALVFSIRSSDKMTIAADGNVGVGITSPVGKLQVTNGYEAGLATHGYLMLGSVSGTNMVFDNNEIIARNNGIASNLYLQNGSGNVYIGDPSAFTSVHKLGVDGNTVITGNLRIGTTPTPSGYKLAVDGKMICTEVMVRLVGNWPDYVFSGNHRIPDLNEVENFIKKNQHLPGIPAARDIESNGLNIGEMQKKQMEKIEELTLYVIELKKEVEALKAKQPVQ